uniref:Uncharacterized protein n=1 Tax=Aegilops tauschii subsp. strangulata TaxID=200361 RepID=A0A453QBC5_AEGTS
MVCSAPEQALGLRLRGIAELQRREPGGRERGPPRGQLLAAGDQALRPRPQDELLHLGRHVQRRAGRVQRLDERGAGAEHVQRVARERQVGAVAAVVDAHHDGGPELLHHAEGRRRRPGGLRADRDVHGDGLVGRRGQARRRRGAEGVEGHGSELERDAQLGGEPRQALLREVELQRVPRPRRHQCRHLQGRRRRRRRGGAAPVVRQLLHERRPVAPEADVEVHDVHAARAGAQRVEEGLRGREPRELDGGRRVRQRLVRGELQRDVERREDGAGRGRRREEALQERVPEQRGGAEQGRVPRRGGRRGEPVIEPRQYLARASGVPGVGAAGRLEQVVHRRLGLEISISSPGGACGGRDREMDLLLRMLREGELRRELREREGGLLRRVERRGRGQEGGVEGGGALEAEGVPVAPSA